MPIAVEMDGPTSPVSPRMTKAAFFRARSPPALDRSSATGTARAHSPNDLAVRFQQLDGPSRSLEAPRMVERGYASSVGTAGHTPPTEHPARMEQTGGSDEMLLSLLAGQAAVDCEAFVLGGWEEVEGWKKVGRV